MSGSISLPRPLTNSHRTVSVCEQVPIPIGMSGPELSPFLLCGPMRSRKRGARPPARFRHTKRGSELASPFFIVLCTRTCPHRTMVAMRASRLSVVAAALLLVFASAGTLQVATVLPCRFFAGEG